LTTHSALDRTFLTCPHDSDSRDFSAKAASQAVPPFYHSQSTCMKRQEELYYSKPSIPTS